MLQSENRLTKVRDFNLVMNHGRWVNGSFLDLKFVELAKIQNYFPKKENPENFKKQLRLAFSIGLKVSKIAVKRNRLRRQLREITRLFIQDQRLVNGYFVLVIAKKEALFKNYAEISAEIEFLLKKARIIKD